MSARQEKERRETEELMRLRADVHTVGDLDERHYGYEVLVEDPKHVTGRKVFHFIDHRTWEYQSVQRVGLCSSEGAGGAIVGTEYHYDADRPCKLLRLIKKPPRSRQQPNWFHNRGRRK